MIRGVPKAYVNDPLMNKDFGEFETQSWWVLRLRRGVVMSLLILALQPVVLITQEGSLSREGGRHYAARLPGQGDQGDHHHQQHLQAVIQYFPNSSAGKSFENA